MSPDMLTAFVLWSAHPDCEDAAQHELESRSAFFAHLTLQVDSVSKGRTVQCIMSTTTLEVVLDSL